jgi:hypothetical protein
VIGFEVLEGLVTGAIVDSRVGISDWTAWAIRRVIHELVFGFVAVELIAVRLFVCIAVHDVEQTDCNCDEALQLRPIELRKNARHGWNAWRTRRMM